MMGFLLYPLLLSLSNDTTSGIALITIFYFIVHIIFHGEIIVYTRFFIDLFLLNLSNDTTSGITVNDTFYFLVHIKFHGEIILYDRFFIESFFVKSVK